MPARAGARWAPADVHPYSFFILLVSPRHSTQGYSGSESSFIPCFLSTIMECVWKDNPCICSGLPCLSQSLSQVQTWCPSPLCSKGLSKHFSRLSPAPQPCYFGFTAHPSESNATGAAAAVLASWLSLSLKPSCFTSQEDEETHLWYKIFALFYT